MTPQQIELALETIALVLEDLKKTQEKQQATITTLEEVLKEHAMQEVQRLGQEIEQEPLEYWNAVEGWVKIDEVREHFETVGCATIYKTAGEGRVPLSLAKAQPEQEPVADYIAAKDMLDEQPVPPRTWIGLENAEAGWFCHTDFLNARKYTKKQREYICNQLLSEAQSWDIDQYIRMMHDSTKLKEKNQ